MTVGVILRPQVLVTDVISYRTMSNAAVVERVTLILTFMLVNIHTLQTGLTKAFLMVGATIKPINVREQTVFISRTYTWTDV